MNIKGYCLNIKDYILNIKEGLLYKEILLLFKTAPSALVIWTIAEAVSSFIGPIQSRISKLLFDTIEDNMYIKDVNSVFYSIILVIGLKFAVNLISMLSQKINGLSFTYLGTKVSSGLHKLVIKKLGDTPFIKYEDSKFYSRLHEVKEEVNGGNLIQVYISLIGSMIRAAAMAVMILMLSKFSIFASVIAVAACIPGFIHQEKYGGESWKFATASVPQIRKMTYFFKLIVSPEAFKENKLYGLPVYFRKRQDELYRDYYCKLKDFHSVNCGKGVIMALIHSVGTVFVIGWVYISAARGLISIGDAVMYSSLSIMLYNSVQHIVYSAGSFNRSFRLAGNIIDFISGKQEDEDKREPSSERNRIYECEKNPNLCEKLNVSKDMTSDEIILKNVDFTYPGSNKKVLDGVTFTIKKGQKVAIAGENGSGKSTLAKLLIGLYSSTGGSIFVKGKNINQFSDREIADTFSTCFQDYCIYSYSIRENIGFGNLSKMQDDAYLLDAANKSGFSSIVEINKSAGLDSFINRDFCTNGLVLSGGQSQKLALARAFSSTGDILVLDEPSASLDIVSEHEIFEKTLSLMKVKTVFIITHRLANIISADIILYIKNGKICESGTHKELMQQKGEYAMLFELQAERYGVVVC